MGFDGKAMIVDRDHMAGETHFYLDSVIIILNSSTIRGGCKELIHPKRKIVSPRR